MELMPERVASLMSAVGSERFGKAMLDLFEPEFEVTHCAAFTRENTSTAPRPMALASVTDDGSTLVRELAGQWVSEGLYRSDPWLSGIEGRCGMAPAVYFDDVPTMAGRAGHAAVVEDYYDVLEVGEDVTYTWRDCGRVLCVSLYRRRGRSTFNASQREFLGRLSPLVLQGISLHARMLPEDATLPTPSAAQDVAPLPAPSEAPGSYAGWMQARSEKLRKLRAALMLDRGNLTLREAEICAYIVMGYTGFAISSLLEISHNTVCTHRKRAYSKLGVSSQTELFNICLRYLI